MRLDVASLMALRYPRMESASWHGMKFSNTEGHEGKACIGRSRRYRMKLYHWLRIARGRTHGHMPQDGSYASGCRGNNVATNAGDSALQGI